MKNQCICCSKEIKVTEEGDHRTVHDATIWRSHGNYGSGVYDSPTNNTFLEALIFDDCLKRLKPLLWEVSMSVKRVEISRKEPDL